jgi:hypothetical protein
MIVGIKIAFWDIAPLKYTNTNDPQVRINSVIRVIADTQTQADTTALHEFILWTSRTVRTIT